MAFQNGLGLLGFSQEKFLQMENHQAMLPLQITRWLFNSIKNSSGKSTFEDYAKAMSLLLKGIYSFCSLRKGYESKSKIGEVVENVDPEDLVLKKFRKRKNN